MVSSEPRYRESILLGHTLLSPKDVRRLVRDMKKERRVWWISLSSSLELFGNSTIKQRKGIDGNERGTVSAGMAGQQLSPHQPELHPLLWCFQPATRPKRKLMLSVRRHYY